MTWQTCHGLHGVHYRQSTVQAECCLTDPVSLKMCRDSAAGCGLTFASMLPLLCCYGLQPYVGPQGLPGSGSGAAQVFRKDPKEPGKAKVLVR